MYTLDPRDSFVVYSNDVKRKRMLGVKYNTDEFGQKTYSAYTAGWYFTVKDGKVTEQKAHALGVVPIIEYPANNARLGAFEIVLPLLDAINNIESNRMDGIEQFIQAFVKFINCDITKEDFESLKDLGAIKVKSVDGQQADVDIVTNELNQQQTQTLKDDAYQAVLTICGMPNRNGGSSTSDTGSAVLLRDGWSLAESRAKDSELMFKRSEKETLRLVLKLCGGLADLNLKLKDIDMKFTRRNYDNIQSKSQVLVSMLQQPKVHPLLAFTHCGLFSDPESAYTMSNEYYEEQMAKWEPVDVDESDDDDKDVSEEDPDVQTG
jgi:SPP1 family phage portal protein